MSTDRGNVCPVFQARVVNFARAAVHGLGMVQRTVGAKAVTGVATQQEGSDKRLKI